ncbi:MAG: PIN domain-containing protein [Anaerolineales bacterium]|nr:PIN domain-containing protein [Anaerolineales bacterium]
MDTSAFYSLLDRDDANHGQASLTWQQLMVDEVELITSNYVLLETTTLLQNRLGIEAARDFNENMACLTTVCWVDNSLHENALAAVLVANRRRLSLVDCVSFVLCRRLGIDRAFSFDNHFDEQGLLPPYK